MIQRHQPYVNHGITVVVLVHTKTVDFATHATNLGVGYAQKNQLQGIPTQVLQSNQITGEQNAINPVCDSFDDNSFLRATFNKNLFPVISEILHVNVDKFALSLYKHPSR